MEEELQRLRSENAVLVEQLTAKLDVAGTPDMIRGWLEKGTTWQSRALHAEKRLKEAYARMRWLDEQLTALKMGPNF